MSDFINSFAFGFLSPKTQKRRLKERKQYEMKMLRKAGVVDWADVTSWRPWLYLNPRTFLEAEDHLAHLRPSQMGPGKTVVLRKDELRLDWFCLPRYEPVGFTVGLRRGICAFTQSHHVPRLAYKSLGAWLPRMSLSPQEVMTQRRGISFTKGHVVVGGLGLGWSVWKIAQRKQVKKITIIEKDKDVLRVIKPKLRLPSGVEFDWIHGDMNIEAPKLKADILFADIWDSYGYRNYDRSRLVSSCPNIDRVWCWAQSGGG